MLCPDMRILITLTILIVLCGCSRGRKESAPTKVDNHKNALTMYEKMVSFDSVIAMQNLALEDMRRGRSAEPAYAVLSQMGYFQSRAGHYYEGLRYLQEASDSLRHTPAEQIDSLAAIKLLGNLSNLYVRFGLYDEALTNNKQAMLMAQGQYRGRRSDLWRMRGIIYQYRNMPDSQLYCLRMAVAISAHEADEVMRRRMTIFNENARAWFFIENPDYAPDSVPAAVALLERNDGKYSMNNDNTNMLMIGRGYVLMGQYAKGLPMMEKAVEQYKKTQSWENLEWAMGLLADSYVRSRSPKIFDIYQRNVQLHDSLEHSRRDDVLLGKDFQYRTSILANDNSLLEARLRLTRQRTLYLLLIGCVVLAVGLLFFFSRRKQQKALLRQKQQSIDSLIADRIILNSRIEALNVQLESDERERTSNQALLTTVLLDKDDELRFRKMFSELHPGFVEKLRSDYPGITSGNELLCMLIALSKSNEEIALALGISRESVATARYRLRSRMGLTKEADLNNIIQSRL